MFLLYINDLALEPLCSNLDIYLDGTMYSSGNSVTKKQISLHEELNTVERWFKLNNMAINPKKAVLLWWQRG